MASKRAKRAQRRRSAQRTRAFVQRGPDVVEVETVPVSAPMIDTSYMDAERLFRACKGKAFRKSKTRPLLSMSGSREFDGIFEDADGFQRGRYKGVHGHPRATVKLRAEYIGGVYTEFRRDRRDKVAYARDKLGPVFRPKRAGKRATTTETVEQQAGDVVYPGVYGLKR